MNSKPLIIDRVLISPMRGSSRPVLVDSSDGKYLVKLRGAAQGTGALVAEIIVARLAEALDLSVLPRVLLVLKANTPIEDRDAELKDLLAFSIGTNLGFPLLDGARVVGEADCAALTPRERLRVLWLDLFVLNPDRTRRNPNMLVHGGKYFLIDHGAALRFQYDWLSVTEKTPRDVGL